MRKSATVFAGLAMVLAVAGCNGYTKESHSATLAGGAAVAATGTPAIPASTETGAGTVSLTFDGPAAEWQVAITGGLANVTAIHIHHAVAGVAGPIYVVLYDTPAAGPTPTVTTLKGAFSAEQVTACLPAPTNAGGTACEAVAARTFANIQAATGSPSAAYIDVHTTVNPAGALRGQIQ